MSDFKVCVEKIDSVENHPNADRLSLIQIKGYTAISAKLEDGSHRYNPGDLVVYIPCASIVPEYILRDGFWDESKNKGMLAGSNGDRVKEIRLRGIFSEGILLPVVDGKISNQIETISVFLDDDVSEFLGITKYEPPIPVNMAGEVYSESRLVKKFDLENIKNHPNVIQPNDEVVMTEKIHGTNFRIVIHPNLKISEAFFDGYVSVTSKGLGNQGLFFKNNQSNENNLYVKTLKTIEHQISGILNVMTEEIMIFGEIYGHGVQDLTYGTKNTEFRVFEVCVNRKWLDWNQLVDFCKSFDLSMVPVAYIGPYNLEILRGMTDGITMIENGNNIREGVVVKPIYEREYQNGRVIFKSVSENYLMRKGATEFN